MDSQINRAYIIVLYVWRWGVGIKTEPQEPQSDIGSKGSLLNNGPIREIENCQPSPIHVERPGKTQFQPCHKTARGFVKMCPMINIDVKHGRVCSI